MEDSVLNWSLISTEVLDVQVTGQRIAILKSDGNLYVMEGGLDELRQCSMVVARYGVPGLVTGTLGVLGPMRMSYARTIPTVRYVAGLLSDLVNDTISGE